MIIEREEIDKGGFSKPGQRDRAAFAARLSGGIFHLAPFSHLCYTAIMIVSMLQVIFEIPGVDTIKEKRRIVQSVKMKLQKRFHLSASEVDLQESLSFSQIGAVMASNSKQFGETVMRKAFEMIENETPVRIHDMAIHSDEF